MGALVASEALAGLTATPKSLTPTWLYDERGCELFDDDHPPARVLPDPHRALDPRPARAPEIAAITGADTLVELGAGTSEKTRSCSTRWRMHRRAAALRSVRRRRGDAARAVEAGSPTSIRDRGRTAWSATSAATSVSCRRGGRRLIAFLGGTIGNLAPAERADDVLRTTRRGMAPGDALLLGTDLVKDRGRLVAAYDDAAGVTAAFNKNVLHGAQPRARRRLRPRRLRPRRPLRRGRRVDRDAAALTRRADGSSFRALGLTLHFDDGEDLRTEISAKFRVERVGAELAAAGLELVEWWTDDAGDFALSLAVRDARQRTARALDYCDVRTLTEQLAAPLSAEDQTVQSMPDVSPTKWHRAHTTWFFETFVLEPHAAGYRAVRSGVRVPVQLVLRGGRPAAPARRARADHAARHRRDRRLPRATSTRAMLRLLDGALDADVAALVELGLHHEQQHQELIADGHQARAVVQPAAPGVRRRCRGRPARRRGRARAGIELRRRHRRDRPRTATGSRSTTRAAPRPTLLQPFAHRRPRWSPAASGSTFIADGGYQRPELWLSDGWADGASANGWDAPLYWHARRRRLARVHARRPARRSIPTRRSCHVSWFEADAYARWAGARLPTRSRVGGRRAGAGTCARRRVGLVRRCVAVDGQPLLAVPGLPPAAGAVGEYNGKFMVNQHVLRGSCLRHPARPRPRARTATSSPPTARWAFAGLRLARDVTT